MSRFLLITKLRIKKKAKENLITFEITIGVSLAVGNTFFFFFSSLLVDDFCQVVVNGHVHSK